MTHSFILQGKNEKHTYSRAMLLMIFLCLSFVVSCKSNRQPKSSERPNILLIMSDDMGYSDLGSYGSSISTPNLDRLAETGLRYTDFHNVPHCSPSRAALLTGLYPAQSGLGWMTARNYHLPGYSDELNEHSVTIAQVLKKAGYATFMTGKWHLSLDTKANGPKYNWPLQRGFDKFYGIIKGASNYYDPATLTRGNTQITPYTDSLYQPNHYYFTNAITDNTVKFLQDRPKDEPFFMYVAYTAAHWPMQAPEEEINKYKGKFDKGWGALRRQRFQKMKQMGILDSVQSLSPLDTHRWSQERDKKAMERRMETYAAMISIMDRGIGKIVDELKRQGVYNNTLILYLQDNGGNAEGVGFGGPHGETRPVAKDTTNLKPLGKDEIQTKPITPITQDGKIVKMGKKVMAGPADTYLSYLKPWANVSNTPFRMYKNFVYEGGTSTPLIVHWPNGIKSQGAFRRQVSHEIDIMPTIMQVTQTKYPKTFDGNSITPEAGVSLVPTFSNKPLKPRALFWAHEANRAVRMGRWKLVSGGILNGGYGHWKNYESRPWELYNMNNDRSEMKDVSAEHPKLVQKMARMWREWAHKTHVLPMPWKQKQPPVRSYYMSTPWNFPDF